jgi:hypothetical protein
MSRIGFLADTILLLFILHVDILILQRKLFRAIVGHDNAQLFHDTFISGTVQVQYTSFPADGLANW